MAATTFDTSLIVGMTDTITVTVPDSDNGGMKNLTGATITYEVWSHTPAGDTLLITKGVGTGITLTDPTHGICTISIAPTDTASLTPAAYPHACVVIDASGNKATVFNGMLTLLPVAPI